MQVYFTLEKNGVVDIPVNYSSLVRAAIFQFILDEDEDYAQYLLDKGFDDENKELLFTFGEFIGENHRYANKLYFEEGRMILEIRSPSADFIRILSKAAKRIGYMNIGKHRLAIADVSETDHKMHCKMMTVRTVSPVSVRKQGEEEVWYAPDDIRAISRMRQIFEKKYETFYGEKPDSSIDILPVDEYSKVLRNYNNNYMTAYYGDIQLYGEKEYLDFLYDVGLGEKCSLGLGMFKLVRGYSS